MVYIHPLSLLCSTDYHEIWGGIKGPSLNMAQIYLFLISTHMFNIDTKSCHAQVAQDTEMWKYSFLFNRNLNWLKDRAHLSTFKFVIFEKFSCFIVLVVFLVIVQSSELISV